jgi:type IV pilus assembly protein PilB
MIAHRRIGEILVEQGLLEAKLREALQIQQLMPGTPLGVALVRIGAVTEEDVAAALAMQLGLRSVDLDHVRVEPRVVWLLDRATAERRSVLPYQRRADGTVLLACTDPRDAQGIREIEGRLGGKIELGVCTPAQLRLAIERHYGLESVAERMLRGVDPALRKMTITPTCLELDAKAIQDHLRAGKAHLYVELVNLLLINAIERRASDIHIEPQHDGIRVRLRIDGVLREVLSLPDWTQTSLISRFKVLAQMDVSERRRPQDGKASVRLGLKNLDLRVATLPSQYGESMVIRLLDPDILTQDFGDLGWSPDLLRTWYRLLTAPRGTLLVVGPTGSGKSTTLYASIQRLNTEGTAIVTVEDPIEYTVPGITQVQVNEKAGVTFAKSVRALLRQDPNVVVIGEIRDEETAQAALQAATTGHLVLTTLHTDNAVAALTRLLDLDVPRYLLGSALTGIVSQRLVRRVCPECAIPDRISPEDWMRLGLPPADLGERAVRVGPGCPRCQYIGYDGRIGIFEMLSFGRTISQLVQEGCTENELWDAAVEEGLKTLLQDGIEKVIAGVTTLEEVARVVSIADYPREALRSALANLGLNTLANAPEPVVEAATTSLEAFDEIAEIEEISQSALVELDPVALEPIDAPDLAPASLSRPARPRSRPVVLVVDDAQEILQLVSMALEDDYEIHTAEDGLEAMSAVDRVRPDLIVLDVMMPRMSGYEVCQALSEKPETKDIPVLMLSARGEKAHVKKGFYAGADDYLPKPFDPEELLLRSRALLRRSGWNF